MSIPKKGSRKIIVDGCEYLWLVRAKPTYSQAYLGGMLVAAVEPVDFVGSVLRITFDFSRHDALIKIGAGAVTPGLIEYCIKRAILGGWNPELNSGVFEYTHKSIA